MSEVYTIDKVLRVTQAGSLMMGYYDHFMIIFSLFQQINAYNRELRSKDDELDELQTNFNKMCDLNDELTSRLDVADKLCDLRAKNNKLLKDLLDRADTKVSSVTCTQQF